MNVELKVGDKYRFQFEVEGQILNYTGTIISLENDFISFIDIFGEEVNYALRYLVNARPKVQA